MARVSKQRIVSATPEYITTSGAELKYQRVSHEIQSLCKEEVARKLRVKTLLSEHAIEAANEKLRVETERGDEADLNAREWQMQAEQSRQEFERTMQELRIKSRELETLRSELSSLEHISADSAKVLKEKLSLASELANLKPELEHLRDQMASHEKILSENFALQRRLNDLQAELENEKQSLQHHLAKQDKSAERDTRLESEMEQLKKDLAAERKARENAEKNATKSDKEHLDSLKKELAEEKKEREKAEKAASKAEARWDTQKASLEDKLDQFRGKLRATKEKLKETEDELQRAQTTEIAKPTMKTQRKRPASQIDSDAAIGTPGDAGANKRSKRASSVVGEKSTFSITPFLNRKSSNVFPQSGSKDAQQESADEPMPSVEEEQESPTGSRAQSLEPTFTNKNDPNVLAPARPGKSNPKVPAASRRKAASASLTLEKVTEEDDAGNVENIAENVGTVVASSAALARSKSKKEKPVLKPRQLSSFSSFRDASLPPAAQPVQFEHKKKRKLLGGAKTLFDEDEDEEGTAGGGLFGAGKGKNVNTGGQRAFGAFGGKGFGALGLLGAGKKKAGLVTAADGFQFSPLKKDRRALVAATSEAPEVVN